MRHLSSIRDDFALDFHVSFNGSKYKYVIFPPVGSEHRFIVPDPVLRVGNSVIEHIHYLHTLTSDLNDAADIVRLRSCFEGHTNNLLSQFSALDSLTVDILFITFCSSHYGCVFAVALRLKSADYSLTSCAICRVCHLGPTAY
jgi:hypothetical protein